MPTAAELGLFPGSEFHYNQGRVSIMGRIHSIDSIKGIDVWVSWCNLSAPIEDVYPEGKHNIAIDDTGFVPFSKRQINLQGQ